MPKNTSSISNFLLNSRILIENAQNIPESAAVLLNFGYNPTRMAEGAQLLSTAEALVQKQTKEYGESYQATVAFNQAYDAANLAYTQSLKIARIVFGDEAKAGTILKLYGPRLQTTAGWLSQASSFYTGLTSDSELAGRLAKFGYTAEKIAAEAALVETVRKALQAQAKEYGEAQEATVERDRTLAELDTWVSELRAVSKVAFAANPQELEKLGILALNAPRAKKKVESAVK